MTDNSNAIKELISKTAGGVITRDAAKQALYEAVVGCVPPNGSKYEFERNRFRAEVLTNLAELFGVEK